MFKKLLSPKGYVMILVAVTIPVFLLFVDYAIKRMKMAHNKTTQASAAYAVGAAVLTKYNPGKTWTKQKNKIYSAGAQALCDRGFDLEKSMIMSSSPVFVYYSDITKNNSSDKFNLAKMYYCLSSYGIKNGKFKLYVSSNSLITDNSLLCDNIPINNVVFTAPNSIKFNLYSTSGGTESYSAVSYTENEKLNISLDTSGNFIKCDCKHLKKIVKAYPAECNVDIILTLPTNHAANTTSNSNSGTLVAPNVDGINSTPIVRISKCYAKFLKEHFLNTNGVAVGVIPYSAKISIPPNRSNWTVVIPPMNKTPSQPYIKQAAAYGTDGQAGGELFGDGALYSWGNESDGFPIMFRQGYRAAQSFDSYRGVSINLGTTTANLLSTNDPNQHGTNDYKFQRMNLNPCYLGYCNLLAKVCEKTCSTYMANPYFITELTDDLQNVIYDLSLIRPINDAKNKSNFLFLAIQWAQNLLETWTAHPNSNAVANEKLAHTARSNKKRAIILIVNAPDHFEPQELTYLGFNNDNSEIPMHESDCIRFDNGATSGTKGILSYTGGGKYVSSEKGLVISGSGTGKLVFPKKGLIKLVFAPQVTDRTITFYEDGGVKDNINTYQISSPTVFSFGGPSYSGTSVTFGKNFGNNYSLDKVKYSVKNVIISDCTLTDQVLRYSKDGMDPAVAMYRSGSNKITSYYKDYDDTFSIIFMGIKNMYLYYTIDKLRESSCPYVYFVQLKSGDDNNREPITTNEGIKFLENSFNKINKLDSFYYTQKVLCKSTNSANCGLMLRDPPSYFYLTTFYALNNEVKGYISNCSDKDLQNNKGVTFNENYIRFNGDGKLNVTVKPVDNKLTVGHLSGSNKTFDISQETTIYLTEEELSNSTNNEGLYYIELSMKNIKLIIAEVTNRAYKKVPASCSLEGETQAKGNSEKTVKAIFSMQSEATIQAKVANGSITFSGTQENTGTHTINGTTEFIFSGPREYSDDAEKSSNNNTNTPAQETSTDDGTSQETDGNKSSSSESGYLVCENSKVLTLGENFKDNYSLNKVRYKIENAKIDSCTLNSQLIRYCEKGIDPAFVMYYSGENSVTKWIDTYDDTFSIIFMGVKDFKMFYDIMKRGSYSQPNVYFVQLKSDDNSNRKPTTTSEGIKFLENSYYRISKLTDYYGQIGKSFVSENSENSAFLLRDQPSYFYLKGIYAWNKISVPWKQSCTENELNNNRCVTADNEYIKFNGDGQLVVRVTTTGSGTISYTDINSTQKTIHVTSIDSYQALKISPRTHLYKKQRNGKYEVELKLKNVQISNIKLDNENEYTYTYAHPDKPTYSRVVDFSINQKNKPMYDANTIVFGQDQEGNMESTGVKYDADLSYWVTDKKISNLMGYNHFYRKGIIGDWFMQLDNIGNSIPTIRLFSQLGSKYHYDLRCEIYLFSGLHRIFQQFGEYREDSYASFDICGDGVECSYMYGGFTLPINYALYNNNYQKVDTNTNNDVTNYTSPDMAVANVTASAFNKLTELTNTRIYVINYGVGEPPFNCNKDNVTTYYANSESALNQKLQEIAEDIKSFAQHKDPAIASEQ